MAKIIPCIDCNQPVSEMAKMCPNCGRPWPKDGKSLILKRTEKVFKFILSNFFYLLSILILGPLVGATIKAYQDGNDRNEVNYYFWSEFISSAFIGIPTLLVSMGLIIGLWMAVIFIWLRLSDFYLALEYKIISLKQWPELDEASEKIRTTLKLENIERRRRLIFRWIIAFPLILIFVDYLY